MLPMLRLLGFALCCVAIFSAVPMRSQAAGLVFGPSQSIEARSGGLYVSVFGGSQFALDEYALPDAKNGRAKCQVGLPQFPYATYDSGLSVNAQGLLYVPSASPEYGLFGAGFPVYTYRPNCGGRGPTLNQQFGTPTDVAFNKKSGAVYVAFFSQNYIGGYVNGVLKFDRGATYPTEVLTNPAFLYTSGVIAVNSHGDVFAASANAFNFLVEYPGGRQQATRVLNLPGLSYPSGLEFDRNDNLIVSNAYSHSIDVYAPPYRSAPRLTIKTNPSEFDLFVKLDAANHNLYAANYSSGSVDVYAYPSGSYEYSITTHTPNALFGIAVDPSS